MRSSCCFHVLFRFGYGFKGRELRSMPRILPSKTFMQEQACLFSPYMNSNKCRNLKLVLPSLQFRPFQHVSLSCAWSSSHLVKLISAETFCHYNWRPPSLFIHHSKADCSLHNTLTLSSGGSWPYSNSTIVLEHKIRLRLTELFSMKSLLLLPLMAMLQWSEGLINPSAPGKRYT